MSEELRQMAAQAVSIAEQAFEKSEDALDIGNENSKSIVALEMRAEGYEKLQASAMETVHTKIDGIADSVNSVKSILLWGGAFVFTTLVAVIGFLLTHPEAGIV